MKLRIRVPQAPPDPRFIGVARIIAKGKPPAWLAIRLESFSDFVASERLTLDEQHQVENAIEQMHDAADKLIKWLPFFSHLPGIECPDDVAVALDVLLRIKKMLADTIQTQRRG